MIAERRFSLHTYNSSTSGRQTFYLGFFEYLEIQRLLQLHGIAVETSHARVGYEIYRFQELSFSDAGYIYKLRLLVLRSRIPHCRFSCFSYQDSSTLLAEMSWSSVRLGIYNVIFRVKLMEGTGLLLARDGTNEYQDTGIDTNLIH